MGILPELLELIKEWSRTHKKYTGLNLYINDFFNCNLKNAILMFLKDKQGVIKQYKITQKISPSMVFMVDSKSLIEENRYNLMKASFLKTVDLWKGTSKKIVFNLGSGKEKGYKEAKESLKPEKLRMYLVKHK